jgi:hypothetical protein
MIIPSSNSVENYLSAEGLIEAGVLMFLTLEFHLLIVCHFIFSANIIINNVYKSVYINCVTNYQSLFITIRLSISHLCSLTCWILNAARGCPAICRSGDAPGCIQDCHRTSWTGRGGPIREELQLSFAVCYFFHLQLWLGCLYWAL